MDKSKATELREDSQSMDGKMPPLRKNGICRGGILYYFLVFFRAKRYYGKS